MSVGIVVPLPAYTLDPAFIAKKAEDLGFESIWYHEHPILPVKSESSFPSTGGEIPWTYGHFSEPYISLAMGGAAAGVLHLGPGTCYTRSLREPGFAGIRGQFRGLRGQFRGQQSGSRAVSRAVNFLGVSLVKSPNP